MNLQVLRKVALDQKRVGAELAPHFSAYGAGNRKSWCKVSSGLAPEPIFRQKKTT